MMKKLFTNQKVDSMVAKPHEGAYIVKECEFFAKKLLTPVRALT